MSTYLFLRITDLAKPEEGEYHAEWRVYNEQGKLLGQSEATNILSIRQNLKKIDKNNKTIVLLRGRDVTINEAKIIPQHSQHLQSAITSALEEHLAEPIENVHIAIGKPVPVMEGAVPKQSYTACAVNDAAMRQLMSELTAAGLVPEIVTAETLLLPYEKEHVIALMEDGKVLFRLSPAFASSLEREIFLIFIEDYLRQQSALSELERRVPFPSKLRVMVDKNKLVTTQPFFEKVRDICAQHQVAFEKMTYEGEVMDFICRSWFEHKNDQNVINFLQGSFQVKGWVQSFIAQKKAIAKLFVVWVILQMAVDFGISTYLSARADDFHKQSVTLYQSAFPQDTKIVNLKAQMQQHLQSSAAVGKSGFMSLLYPLTLNDAVKIDNISYDAQKNELTADISAGDFTAFEKFREVGENARYTIEIGSVVREESSMRGKIKVQGKS